MSECTCGQYVIRALIAGTVKKSKAGGRTVKKGAALKKGGAAKKGKTTLSRIAGLKTVIKKKRGGRRAPRAPRVAGCAECGCSRVGGCGCGQLPVEYEDVDE